MASMTIRDLDEKLKARLRLRAARHGRSMEEEARDILRSALAREPSMSRGLVEAIRARVSEFGGVEFEGRVLAFDSAAADEFAEVCASRREAGRPIAQLDAQIAAIVRSRRAELATRNVKDFELCGIEVVNPWEC